jgi:hypothetical protein
MWSYPLSRNWECGPRHSNFALCRAARRGRNHTRCENYGRHQWAICWILEANGDVRSCWRYKAECTCACSPAVSWNCSLNMSIFWGHDLARRHLLWQDVWLLVCPFRTVAPSICSPLQCLAVGCDWEKHVRMLSCADSTKCCPCIWDKCASLLVVEAYMNRLIVRVVNKQCWASRNDPLVEDCPQLPNTAWFEPHAL